MCSARSNTVRIANTEFLRIDGRPSEVETARSAGPPIAPRRVLSLSPARELHEQRFLGRSTHFLILLEGRKIPRDAQNGVLRQANAYATCSAKEPWV